MTEKTLQTKTPNWFQNLMSNHDGLPVLMAILSYMLFSVCDVIAKLTVGHLPSPQILFTAHITGLLVCLGIAFYQGKLATLLRPQNLKYHSFRGGASILSATSVLIALRTLPLPDFYGIVFLTPIVICIVSALMLHERMPKLFYGLVLLGFGGVLFVVRPGFQTLGLAHFATLGVVISFTIMSLMSRKIGHSEYTPRFSFFVHIMHLALWTPLVIMHGWQPIGFDVVWKLMLYGVALSGAIALIAQAFAKAKMAGHLAPIHYTQMLWGIVFGYLIFAQPVSLATLVGAAIVIGSGIAITKVRPTAS